MWDVTFLACRLISFWYFFQGTGELASVLDELVLIVIWEACVLDSRALVGEAAHTLECLHTSRRIRETPKDEQGDAVLIVLCTEVEATGSKVFVDQVDWISMAELRIHSLKGKVRLNFGDRSDVIFQLQLFILLAVRVDKDSALIAFVKDEGAEIVYGT